MLGNGVPMRLKNMRSVVLLGALASTGIFSGVGIRRRYGVAKAL